MIYHCVNFNNNSIVGTGLYLRKWNNGVPARREERGCERNTERTLSLWNGRLAEITIRAVRTEQWVVLCWKRECCIGKGCFFVVHITGLIRTSKVENICSALRAVGGRPCTSCALEPHKHTCKKTHVCTLTFTQSTRCSFPAWKAGPGRQHHFLSLVLYLHSHPPRFQKLTWKL